MVAGLGGRQRRRGARPQYPHRILRTRQRARQKRPAIVSALAVALMFAALAVLGARIAWDEYTFGETSPGIGVPSWWYSMWLPVLSLAITLRALALLQRNVRALKALHAARSEATGSAGAGGAR